jgi:glycosyltransferase involved in cell wall biosynthesis
VHFFLPEPYLVGSLASMLAGIDNRIMSRRSLAHYQIQHPVMARLEVWLHRHTRVLLANSQAVRDELVRECGNPSKVGLIYSGIDLAAPENPELRMKIRRDLGIPADCLVLIVVANLIAYKGHADLIQALALVNRRLPPDWRLLLVGRDDGAGPALKTQAASHGLQDHMVWLGERPDAEQLCAAADIAVLPSHQEGFSNSLIEAMARGIPVIATAVGGNLDAVVSGQTGLLVPVDAPPALAAAILELAADGGRRSQMGAAARRRVATLFSLEACVRRYVNLYRSAARFGAIPVRAIIEPSPDQGVKE